MKLRSLAAWKSSSSNSDAHHKCDSCERRRKKKEREKKRDSVSERENEGAEYEDKWKRQKRKQRFPAFLIFCLFFLVFFCFGAHPVLGQLPGPVELRSGWVVFNLGGEQSAGGRFHFRLVLFPQVLGDSPHRFAGGSILKPEDDLKSTKGQGSAREK